MTIISATISCDEIYESGDDAASGIAHDGDARARVANDAAENGMDQEAGPLTWLNSASVHTDAGQDAVYCSVSVGDPRGAFVMTVRRLPDGRIVIHLPHPGEGMAHMPTAQLQLHEGTLVITTGEKGEPADFSDPEPETREGVCEICENQEDDLQETHIGWECGSCRGQ